MASHNSEKTGLLCTEIMFRDKTPSDVEWSENSGSRMTWLKVADEHAERVSLFNT